MHLPPSAVPACFRRAEWRWARRPRADSPGMCLRLSGGRLLLRCSWSGPDSLFWLMFFCCSAGSRRSPGRASQAPAVTDSAHEVAARGAVAACPRRAGGQQHLPPAGQAPVPSGASPFSLRKGRSEACACADCFGRGSGVLPCGLCYISREILCSAPDLTSL